MATRSTRDGAIRSESQTPRNALTAIMDLPRRQLALMTHSATALYRGSQELQRIQQESAQRATERHEDAALRLREPCDFGDLLAVQAELWRFNVQEATHWWNQFANAALKMQADMVSSAGEAVIDGASEPTLESLQRAFEATLNGSTAAVAATTH